MSSKKTTVVVETMTPEDTVKALISIQDGLKELKAATDQLATILGRLGTMAGLAKDGVVAATAKPAAKPPRYAKPPTTPREAVARLAEALGEAPEHVRRAAAEVRAEYGWKPDSEKPAGKQSAPKPAKQPTKKKPGQAPKPQAKPKPKAEPTDMQTGKKPAPEKKGDDAVRGSSVRRAPHQITLNIGSQPVKELAEQDAKDFLNNHKVFWYQAIRFPDPKRYGVQPRILSAKVVERRNPKFTRAPWTVSVTVEALGDDKKCESWLTGVLTKNKADQE